MSAAKHDITIEQGATFSQQYTLTDDDGTPIDITGYTFRCQGRLTYQSTSTVWSVDNDTLTGITITDAAAGQFTLTISDTVTAAIATGSSGVYDLEAVDTNGVVTRLVEGRWTLSPEVTR